MSAKLLITNILIFSLNKTYVSIEFFLFLQSTAIFSPVKERRLSNCKLKSYLPFKEIKDQSPILWLNYVWNKRDIILLPGWGIKLQWASDNKLGTMCGLNFYIRDPGSFHSRQCPSNTAIMQWIAWIAPVFDSKLLWEKYRCCALDLNEWPLSQTLSLWWLKAKERFKLL